MSNMELFRKIFNSWKLLTFLAKKCVLDVWHGYEYDYGTEDTQKFLQCLPLLLTLNRNLPIGYYVYYSQTFEKYKLIMKII